MRPECSNHLLSRNGPWTARVSQHQWTAEQTVALVRACHTAASSGARHSPQLVSPCLLHSALRFPDVQQPRLVCCSSQPCPHVHHLCVEHLRCKDRLWTESAPGNPQQNQTEQGPERPRGPTGQSRESTVRGQQDGSGGKGACASAHGVRDSAEASLTRAALRGSGRAAGDRGHAPSPPAPPPLLFQHLLVMLQEGTSTEKSPH